MKIILENCKCPSWNELNRAVHWRVRANIREEMHTRVKLAVYEQFRRSKLKSVAKNNPIKLVIEAHYRNNNRHDPDNLYVKPILDALVKIGVLKDDNGDCVESVTLTAKRKMPEDRIIINF